MNERTVTEILVLLALLCLLVILGIVIWVLFHPQPDTIVHI